MRKIVVMLNDITWIWSECISRRKALKASQTALSSSIDVQSCLPWGSSTLAMLLFRGAAQPRREASVTMVIVAVLKGMSILTLSRFSNKVRELTLWQE